MKRPNDIQGQPRLRSQAAQAAWNRQGGAMGGSSRQNNKRGRKTAKLELKGHK